MRGSGAVARFIGEGRRECLVTVSQRAHVRRRNTDAPASGRIQHRRVVFTVQGHGDHIARLCAHDLTGNNQRLAVFGNIYDVVARNDVE